jgi:hypothetical protein
MKTEWSTRCREARGARVRGRRGRLRPGTASRCGWRRCELRWSSANSGELDSLQKNLSHGYQGVRQSRRKGMG